MDFLNHKFPGKWTGSNSPIIWLSYLPNLTPQFLPLGVHQGSCVRTTTLLELTGRIRQAVGTITLNLPNNMRTETEYRYICQTSHRALICKM
jgi:hypothetical protein